MSKAIADASLPDLLPPSIAPDPEVDASAQAADPPLKTVTDKTDVPVIKPAVNDQAEDVVDYLAYEFHVDFYRPGLTLDQKKAMTVNSIDWHRRKGTPAAMSETVQELTGLAPELLERPFFLLGRSKLGTDRLTQAPNNFTFELRPYAAEAKTAGIVRSDFETIAETMKPARCHQAVRFKGFPLGSDYGLLGRDLL